MKDAMELLDKLLLQETLDMKLLLHQSRSKGGISSSDYKYMCVATWLTCAKGF